MLANRQSLATPHESSPLFIIIRSRERNLLPFDDLRQWIAALDRAGELKRIKTETDPILEIAEITDRVSKMHAWGQPPKPALGGVEGAVRPGGPALLFQNVKGHPGSQLLINQFGSDARMKLALGVNSLDEIAARIRM